MSSGTNTNKLLTLRFPCLNLPARISAQIPGQKNKIAHIELRLPEVVDNIELFLKKNCYCPQIFSNVISFNSQLIGISETSEIILGK